MFRFNKSKISFMKRISQLYIHIYASLGKGLPPSLLTLVLLKLLIFSIVLLLNSSIKEVASQIIVSLIYLWFYLLF